MKRVEFTDRLRRMVGEVQSATARFYTTLSRCGSPRQARKPIPQPDPAVREAARRDRQVRYDEFVLSL
jgi:hypothetical protein